MTLNVSQLLKTTRFCKFVIIFPIFGMSEVRDFRFGT